MTHTYLEDKTEVKLHYLGQIEVTMALFTDFYNVCVLREILTIEIFTNSKMIAEMITSWPPIG